MPERNAAYYEADAADPKSIQMLPYQESPWCPLYDAAATLIDKRDPVIDLGCGTGTLGVRLQVQAHQKYLGIDFCKGYIEVAQRRLPMYNFRVSDLKDLSLDGASADTVFTCLEVLEHLDDDLSLVRRIPPGIRFVFSVPNYLGESHVRCFNDPRAIWGRYDGLLEFWAWRSIDLSPPPGRRIHLLGTTRRSDSWR